MPRLPGDASLEHLKNQAKTLLAGARTGDPAALRWLRAYHPDPPAALKLADAQLVVARAYGFASWPKLHAHLDVTERFKRSPHAVGEAADPAGRVPAPRVPDLLAGRPCALGGRRRDAHAGDRARVAAHGRRGR